MSTRPDKFKVLDEVFAMLPPELTLKVKEALREFKTDVCEDLSKDFDNRDLQKLSHIAYHACEAANDVLIEQMELGLHRSE